MKTCKTTGLALIVLLITAILFTACPNTAGSGTGGGGGTVPPAGSPLDGVWKALSWSDIGEEPEYFPTTAPDGTKTQPYFCFWNGKMYDVSEISDSPNPSNNGLYKEGEPIPFTFDGSKIFIEEEHEIASVALSGNTMTLTLKDGKCDIVVFEKTDSPTVQEILDAPAKPAPDPYVKVPYGNLEAHLASLSGAGPHYIEITGPIPPADFTGSFGPPAPGALGKKLKAHSNKKVALKIKDYPAGLTSMFCCFLGCTNLTTAPAIPEGVTKMNGCFNGCTGLTTVPAIPASVTDMYGCFNGCTKLTGVTLRCNYNDGNFDNAFAGCTALQNGGIKVPAGQFDAYKNHAADMGTTREKFAKIP